MPSQVLETARRLFSGQEAVRLDRARLLALLPSVPREVAPTQSADERGEALALLFGAVNWRFFAPDWTPYAPEGGAPSGSSGLRWRMARAPVDWTDLEEVECISAARWRSIVHAPLCDLERRRANLAALAHCLRKQGFGRVAPFLAAHPTIPALLSALVATGCFEDPLLKRAQATVFDVSSFARARTGSHLPGLECLTLMADYRLIQLFLHAGAIVIVDDFLASAIAAGRILEAEDPGVLALRAAVVLCSLGLPELPAAIWDKRLWYHAKQLDRAGELRTPPLRLLTDQF